MTAYAPLLFCDQIIDLLLLVNSAVRAVVFYHGEYAPAETSQSNTL
jgi:hypothetical protein